MVGRRRPTPKQEARLVAWVNRGRKALGKRPIKKLRGGDTDNCPLVRSLDPDAVEVQATHLSVRDDRANDIACAYRTRLCYLLFGAPTAKYGYCIPLPGYVKKFIAEVDAGAYTDLRWGIADE